MNDEKLEPLPSPYEIMDLGDGGTIATTIENWKLGSMKITPRKIGVEKEISALRIWVPLEVKPTVPPYYDITSGTLIAGLLGYLKQPGWEKKRYKITKHGVAPMARFTLEVTSVA